MFLPVVFIKVTDNGGNTLVLNPLDITSISPSKVSDYSQGASKRGEEVNGARLRIRGQVEEEYTLEPDTEIIGMVGQAHRAAKDLADPKSQVVGYDRRPCVERSMAWIRNVRSGVIALNEMSKADPEAPYTYDEVQSALIITMANRPQNAKYNRPIKELIDERREQRAIAARERDGPILWRLLNPALSIAVEVEN